MREMTFIVLNCNNASPSAYIANNNGGNVINTNIYIPDTMVQLKFDIKPVDSFGNVMDLKVFGLPGNSSAVITANQTTNPNIAFDWKPIGGFKKGQYNFFVNIQDDNIPLLSSQTIAFTVHVLDKPFSINSYGNSESKISIIPNPSKGNFVVQHTLDFNNELSVYDYTGRVVHQQNNIKNNETVSVNNLSAGCYMVKVIDKKTRQQVWGQLLIQ